LGPISLILITVAILFLRRPDQFLAPYVWVEDGSFVLREYLENGWRTILYPLAGYLVISTKIISAASFKASILYAPQIAIVLTTLFTCGVVCAIAFSPTHLRCPVLCAFSVLLVPTDPEVFAVSLYAFWWAGILCLLAAMWDEDRDKVWLRYFFIILGGLSSPLAVSLAPVFILRAIVERKGWIAALIALLIGGIQARAMLQARMGTSVSSLGPNTVPAAIQKLAADFLFNGAGLWIGIGLIAIYGAACIWNRKNFGWPFVVLLCIYGIVSASVLLRLSYDTLLIIHKFVAGQRYFFYPFIVLGWLLIWIAAETNNFVRIATALVFMVSIIGAGWRLSSRHDHFSWRDQILKCSTSDTYELPIHYSGYTPNMWKVEMKGSECRDLMHRSLF
jgi:hypothetical protein